MKKIIIGIFLMFVGAIGVLAFLANKQTPQITPHIAPLDDTYQRETVTEPQSSESTPAAIESLYTSTDGAYRINFPGVPSSTSDISRGPVGDIPYTITSVVDASGDEYIVQFADYPEGSIPESTVSDRLEGAVKASLNTPGSKLISADHTTFKGYQAVKAQIVSGDYLVTLIDFIVKDRMYTISISTKMDIQIHFDSFIQSFELVN